MVAESVHAVRVEEPGQPPALYFPIADVHFDLFHDEGHRHFIPGKGNAHVWSIDPRPGISSTASAREWGDGEPPKLDGTDVLWRYADPSPELSWLSGLATFDQDRIRVELVDGAKDDDDRDVTVKRFPTWGDASDLLAMLDVRPDGTGSYAGVAHGDHRRPVVEGSQMLGQAIIAAGRHYPGRRAVSAHMVFTRAADAHHPLRFELEELSGGRTFASVEVTVSQGGRRCASGILLLGVIAPDVIRHAASPPAVPGPYESEPYDMSVTGRDIRVVDGAYTDDPDAPVGPPVIDAWVRFREVPDDPYLHAALLAQFTGHMSIAAALRPHAGIGQFAAHRTLSTAINAIGISLHADVHADRWMLYRHESTFAGDGMTHASCRVHDQDGHLVASFAVDAMVRKFRDSSAAVDDRTAL
jgi:acyl-CoA thioesterase II